MEERYITTIDPGSGSLALSVAKVSDGKTEILYYRETPSEGIRDGVVFNPEKAAGALKKAARAAEDALGIKILQAVVALPRYNVRQISAPASISRDASVCIGREEVTSLKEMAIDSYPIENDEEEMIYGAVAQSFSTDDMIGLQEEDVVGITSGTLEGNFKVFIGRRRSSTNLDKMFDTAGISCAKKIFIPCTRANGTLTESEKENGVALVEIGAGISSVTIYRGGILRHYSSIPLGGRSISEDIKYVFGLTSSLSENIKLAYGGCLPDRLQSLGEKIIQINDDEDGSSQQISVQELSNVITERMKEIAEAILYRIEESGYADKIRSGLVLSGGGANLLNCAMLFKEMSGYNVRIGYPRCKNIITQGCSAICETSACCTVEMLSTVKDDIHVNCTTEPIVVKDPVETEKEDESSDGTLFGEDPGAQEAAKPKKKRKPLIHWGAVKNTVGSGVAKMESLFNESE